MEEDKKDVQLNKEESIRDQINDIEKRIKQILNDEKKEPSVELVSWKVKRKKTKTSNLDE